MRINKKMRKGALRSALTDALQSGKLAVVKDVSFEAPKTKDAVALLQALGLEGKVLLVLPEPTSDGAVEKSFRNPSGPCVAYTQGLGTCNLLLADRVLFTEAALDALVAVGSSRPPMSRRSRPHNRTRPRRARQ